MPEDVKMAHGGCGCEACLGAAQDPGPSLAAVGFIADKPVWTLDQIVTNQIRWDARWANEPITYAFYTQAPAHLAGNSDYGGFLAFTPAQQAATRRVLDSIAEISPLQFVEAPDNQQAVGAANLRLTYAASTTTAQYFTAYASVGISKGDELGDMKRIFSGEMMFNAQRWNGDAELGSRQYYVLIHETLHSLGIPHPGAYNRTANEEITYAQHAEYRQDSGQYSVMSYFSERQTGAFYGGLFASTPLLHDIAVLHRLYGADQTTRTGDTTYGFNSNAGGPYDLTAHPKGSVFCIWDAGGVDTIDLSGFATPVLVDLNPGAFSSSGTLVWNISIAFGADIERGRGGAGGDRLIGNALANVLWGEAGADEVFGGAGDDHVLGGADGDRLFGEAGDDLIGGQDGDDFIDGGSGRDRLYGDAGGDHMIGGTEGDELRGQDGEDLIGGQDGDDFIDGGAGRDVLYGDGGRDHMIGGTEDDRLSGQDGDDLIGGQDGDDFVDGGAGRDTLFGDAGRDHMIGGADNDRLHGQDGDDLIGGQDGDDFIDGGNGRDTLFGDAGRDHMIGGIDDDRLHGQDGDDLIGGQDGDDYIEGGAGRDTLFGDGGADVLFGGAGGDILVGQGGADVFIFMALSDSLGPEADRIIDFEASDRIDISRIDADATAEGDQAFIFVGEFQPGRMGQARVAYDAGANTTTLQLDADGDGAADFVLLLDGHVEAGAPWVL